MDISNDTISVQLIMDGVPIRKSSASQFWPILGFVDYAFKKEPIVIGLYHGTTKPSFTAEYLQQLIDILNNIIMKWWNAC